VTTEAIPTGHNHPTNNPVIVVHYKHEDLPLSNNPAHAFGPFINEDVARAFEEGRQDECYKVILDLYIDRGSVMLETPRLAKAIRLVEATRAQSEGYVYEGPESSWFDGYAADIGTEYDRLEGGGPHVTADVHGLDER
jgi:hypothetical protein